MDDGDDDSYEVGYKKPPKSGQIKPGECRNPHGRRGKKRKASVPTTDAEILAKLDAEMVELNGKMISKREAALRVLHMHALKGDIKAHQMLDKLRQDAKSPEEKKQGGVLVVPATLPLHEWSLSAAIQQAPHRGDDEEAIMELKAQFDEQYGGKYKKSED